MKDVSKKIRDFLKKPAEFLDISFILEAPQGYCDLFSLRSRGLNNTENYFFLSDGKNSTIIGISGINNIHKTTILSAVIADKEYQTIFSDFNKVKEFLSKLGICKIKICREKMFNNSENTYFHELGFRFETVLTAESKGKDVYIYSLKMGGECQSEKF